MQIQIPLDDFAGQDVLGETAKSPRWGIAYKYAAVQVETKSQPLWIIGWYRAFDTVTHETAELKLWIFSGQIKVNKIIQSLRILLCRMRISKAISALLVSCCTSTTACERSTEALST